MMPTIQGTFSTDGARGGIINGATSIPKEIAADQKDETHVHCLSVFRFTYRQMCCRLYDLGVQTK